ncbi:MAG: cell division protein ZapE, partial [Rhodobacteraceae bacterium]|nr:cell division protein ZapE [Paracoccaceae bacterium]
MTRLTDIYAAKVVSGEIHADDAQEAVLPEFDRIREAVETPVKKAWFRKAKPEPINGLYLWGGVGRGKSMLMDLFVEHLSVPVRRVHFHAFMQEIHNGMHEARQRGVEDALAPVAEAVANSVRVLAFDEMQITDITDAMIVGRLFEFLFEAGVVVVTTSNRVPDDLYKDGLNRQLFLPFIAHIKERLTVWEMASPRDYRQNRLQGNQVYFVQANHEARADIDSIWQDLTGGEAAPLVLTVKGRAVTIPAFRNGIGRARFYDLCGAMLGPGD